MPRPLRGATKAEARETIVVLLKEQQAAEATAATEVLLLNTMYRVDGEANPGIG